jgi:hypothetical protein
MYRSNKSLSKEGKFSSSLSSAKKKKASSKLGRHIESTLGFKSSFDKNVALIKKSHHRHPTLPFPNISTKP